MEARIKQDCRTEKKTVQKSESKLSKSITTTSSTTTTNSSKSKVARRPKTAGVSKASSDLGEQDQAAMEAWRRRKNYDPMAAAGKKKEVSRKQSSSSLRSTGGKSPREANETIGLTSERKAPGSAPSSAVSRSSDSSGYLSREGGRGSRVGSVGASQSRTSTAPLRKLVHTASSSSLKNQSSRSSSSLTSREVEFQAWKRRKDYDPLAAARKSSSPAAGLRSNEAPGGGGGGAVSRGRVGGKSAYSPSPTDRMRPIVKSRVSQSQSREMSQSLVVTSQGGLPLHRSSSFHQNQTSEDESGDDYSETAD